MKYFDIKKRNKILISMKYRNRFFLRIIIDYTLVWIYYLMIDIIYVTKASYYTSLSEAKISSVAIRY